VRQSTLPLFACPARPAGSASRTCGGSLGLTESRALPTRRFGEEPDEVREGLLFCHACKAEYPILSGVAFLVPDPGRYLKRYHASLLRDLGRHGELSDAASAWLNQRKGRLAGKDDYGADFRFSQQFEEPAVVARALNPEADALYGGFLRWLEEAAGHGPYDVLAEWAGEVPHRRLALDAGCGGGGLVSRLSTRYGTVFGLDWSFLAVVLARRAVLHLPSPERTYMLRKRCGQETPRPLHLPRAANAEFVVGDAAWPPFPSGLFDAVTSCNVVDIAGIDAPMDAAVRMLAPNGRLFVADPYFFKEGEAPQGDPREVLRRALTSRGLRILTERDGVPWAWATYDRHWRIYFSHCLAAQK
jgi:SAM-dependent methyltransferase